MGRIVSGQDSEEKIEAEEVKREENKKAEGRYKRFCSVSSRRWKISLVR